MGPPSEPHGEAKTQEDASRLESLDHQVAGVRADLSQLQVRGIGHLAWGWIKTHTGVLGGFVAGAAVAVGILILVAVVGTRDISQAENTEKVAHDWRRAMMTLGITPVFPPSEDFHVGDIIAFDDQKPNEKISDDGNGPSSLLFRTMGIAHAPGTEEALRKRYQDVPQFPPTPEKYDGISPVAADRDIFTVPDGL
jgi:hypothetical protein